MVLAYVIMADHVHLLVRADKNMSEILRLLNGIAARRVIQYLSENGFHVSLAKLRGSLRERNHRHSVWHHHTDSLEIIGEDTFRQKLEYIHLNPVRAGYVDGAIDYRYSSARQWLGSGSVDEPLITDHASIQWR